MNRKDLVEELSERFEGNREVAAQALDSVVDVISRSVSAGERVVISGFGEFERKARDAGAKAGEYVPEFKPGKELRDVVNGAREWRDRVSGSLAVVPVAAVEQASRTTASAMRSVAEKARELATELSSAAGTEEAAGSPARSGQAAKKAPARKSSPKTTAKKASSAKKAPAKKTATKTAAAKTPAAKSSAKKAPAKKTAAAKKTPAKKATTQSGS